MLILCNIHQFIFLGFYSSCIDDPYIFWGLFHEFFMLSGCCFPPTIDFSSWFEYMHEFESCRLLFKYPQLSCNDWILCDLNIFDPNSNYFDRERFSSFRSYDFNNSISENIAELNPNFLSNSNTLENSIEFACW